MPMQRMLLLTSIVTLALLAVAPATEAVHQPRDGITALIALNGPHGAMVAEDGQHRVRVQVFQQNETGAWHAVALRATLRVFEDVAPFQAVDRVSIPFTSNAEGLVDITFPADAVGTGTLDVFVTFSELGGNPVPTSHYFAGKTAMLTKGWFGQSDSLDHHSTRVVAA